MQRLGFTQRREEKIQKPPRYFSGAALRFLATLREDLKTPRSLDSAEKE